MSRDEVARAKQFAASRIKKLEECYGEPHRWEFIRKGFDPLGKHTKSGYLVKHYAVVRCKEHSDEYEVIAGIEEIKRYGNLSIRRATRGRPRKYRTDLA